MKKKSRIIAVLMLITLVIFVLYAVNNPQASFPWSNKFTIIFYIFYIAIMIYLFIALFDK